MRVLFLHGFMGCPGDWNNIAEALGPGVECLAQALPGHGGWRLPDHAAAVGFSDSAESVCSALKAALPGHLPPVKTVLVGYSMGGRVALYLALRHPELFAGAFIESATPGLADEHARRARAAHDAAIASTLDGLESGDAFREFLDGWYSNPPFETLHDEHRAALIASRLRNDPKQLAAALKALSVGTQPDLWPELAGLQIPVLVVCGEQDTKYRQIAEEMAARSPRVAVQVMAGCGHNVHFEQPDAYTTVLRGFLDGVQ